MTKKLIGIDIDKEAIRILGVQLRLNGDYIVTQYTAIFFNQGDNLTEKLKKISTNFSFKSNFTVTALPFSQVFVKTIVVPIKLKKKEVRNFLILNAEHYLKSNLRDINLHYRIYEREETTEIRLVGVKKKVVVDYLKMLQVCNIMPKIIDIDLYALVRVIHVHYNNNFNIEALIHIDTKRFILCVWDKEGRIIHTFCDYDSCHDSRSTDEIAQTISDELHSSTLYYRQIKRVFISGLGSRQTGFLETLARKSSYSIIAVDPFLKTRFARKINREEFMRLAPTMMICFGLLLRKTYATN